MKAQNINKVSNVQFQNMNTSRPFTIKQLTYNGINNKIMTNINDGASSSAKIVNILSKQNLQFKSSGNLYSLDVSYTINFNDFFSLKLQ
jgi:hypothetical protein